MNKQLDNRGAARKKHARSGKFIALGCVFALIAGSLTSEISLYGESAATAGDVRSLSQANVLVDPGDTDKTVAARKPAFLETLGIPQAWSSFDGNVRATIAIVDTGADLSHPGIRPYLTDGVNLLQKGKPPQDDNGHGTAVAGVIAAIADAGNAGSGDLASKPRWQGRIMPIKALDQSGAGDEAKLTEGIRYAVEHGADIIVLSLGLRRDAASLRGAVALAESRGVLLVAASGNDAAEFGSKAAVQYPAAYPTVLAVSGATGDQAEARSTHGSETDIAAVWKVETLAIGGGRTSMEGTSMGAPQVAAAAAMLWGAHPDWTPLRVREALRRSAADLEPKGWDPSTGYGMVRVDTALRAKDVPDWREPNDTLAKASAFPLGKEVAGTWSGSKDIDSFLVRIPYDGTLVLEGSAEAVDWQSGLTLYSAGDQKVVRPLSPAHWPVRKGQSYWLKAAAPPLLKDGGVAAAAYRFVSTLKIGADSMEPNDSALSAYTLPARSQDWSGTFHQRQDEDWAVVTLPKEGTLRLAVTTDTTRIDPSLWVQPAGGTATMADENGDGEAEELILRQARAGKYYIRIRNESSENPEPVIGTYTVSLEYITKYEDPNERNDDALTATPLATGKIYNGLIDTSKDNDWFRFTIDGKREMNISMSNIERTAAVSIALKNQKLQTIHTWKNAAGKQELSGLTVLEPGTYYLSITANSPMSNGLYALKLTERSAEEPLWDIAGHWAEKPIRAIVKQGWAAGFADGRFRPDRELTRAEAVAFVVRSVDERETLGLPAKTRFQDLSSKHWAYGSISKAEKAGWLAMYGSSSMFQPDRPMTRGEIAILLAAAGSVETGRPTGQRFRDVPASHPAAAAIEALERKGWLAGYRDGRFQPDEPLTRAECAVILAHLIH
ncbi:S8 family serine peptidase [Cohnella faecalis]|uniref:S8 family serine peptidase n=1 Tax=Cohnella faecalis TaxID=2315694 RepID=UPI001314A6C8|nr:S8 family serine peptidase [Cohnella faecalis]